MGQIRTSTRLWNSQIANKEKTSDETNIRVCYKNDQNSEKKQVSFNANTISNTNR